MSNSYLYTFRFCCDPGFNDEAELAALNRYVGEACVDDVAVFANVEEINTGHMSFEEQDVYLALMRRVRETMAEKGVTMSVNQWHSLMHADIGKEQRPGQNFRPMRDKNGLDAKLCVCPLCENWQAYIAWLYARYAQLGPEILWVEDDFRLHNHEPLDWGGCFCEEHMRLYSARAGRPLSREEFLAGVLQPGEVHPYRQIWLDVSRETMLAAAKAIGDAVQAENPRVKLGLMSSVPHVHAAEGRDWPALIGALAQNKPGVCRIHLPGYQELAPAKYLQNFNMVSMLTRAFLPPDCEVYPELENFPYSRYAKSRRFTRYQLLSSLALGVQGMTIDLYDLNGNGIVWAEGYQDTLRDAKPFLCHMNDLGIFSGKRLGVQVMVSPRSAYTLHTRQGLRMEELYPEEVFFAGLLPAMGVPFAYCQDKAVEGEILAVSGQYLRNLEEEEIRGLFARNFVILNGDAAWTLCEQGLAALAGIQTARWASQGGGEYTYEQAEPGKHYCGMAAARASAVISCSDVLFAEYGEGAEVYSSFYDSYRQKRAAAQVVCGRVLVYPFGHFADPLDIPPMLLNTMRAELLHEVLKRAGARFPVVQNQPYLAPYCFEKGGKAYLYLVNAALDDVSTAQIDGFGEGDCYIYRSCDEMAMPMGRNGGICAVNLPAMETALLEPDAGLPR